MRLTPDGVLEVRVGVHSHGQGMETTLAQVAHEVLGIHPDRVRVVHGDTALTPYSTGTWGSRACVMAGGAVAEACRQLAVRVAAIGAALLQVSTDDVVVADGKVRRTRQRRLASVDRRGRAHLVSRAAEPAARRRQGRPRGHRRLPARSRHRHALLCRHAVVARVDTETGAVVLEDYVIVEDGGKLLNPMIVDGQVMGGLAQGIGTALYEEMPYDSEGQPLAATLADYLLPGATDVPDVRLEHMETLSPWTTFGQKGIGESGAIGPPAAIVNAINDALAPLGAEVHRPAGEPGARARGDPGGAGSMKPAAFDYARPTELGGGAAPARRGRAPGAPARSRWGRCSICAWRSPATLADLRHLPDYAGVTRRRATCCASAPAPRMPRSRTAPCRAGSARSWRPSRAASPIAPVRNRGTIGGSLAHADPGRRLGRRAAGARRHRDRARARRASGASPLDGFVRGIFETALAADELLRAVEVPVLPDGARWGHWKFCRKVGEFSKATACVLAVPGAAPRAVLAALDGPPLVIADASALLGRPGGRGHAARLPGCSWTPWREAIARTALPSRRGGVLQ